MKNEIEYGFWFWNQKLIGVLSMLAVLSGYELDEVGIDIVKQDLKYTNNEKEQWMTYVLNGSKHTIKLKLAYDAEDNPDMIHIVIWADKELKEKLEMLDLFQCMFKNFELEH
ncbi:hypothetical protein V6R21_02810 [Limibacter armeniacum]|uniref:hypothetical protein n=1 Tax=Limibacter armeniacum TaxID=466084 RepID=UPI002FE551FE